ncbi:MAG: M28 family peptidase [Candidatus Hydrogenedentes bacterium]|nr:M28 family peptidase [Candidatus Hydrogenedentota bacterium]
MIQNHATHPVLNDIRFLVEKVGPRQPATDNEQKASRYIRERMETVLDSVTVDEFATVETTAWLESGFHIEFIIVYLISLMWPLAAACYGTVVLFLFIAESTGIALISRLIRMERSQNVVGRLRNPFATRNVVVVAHYDTPKWTLPYQPDSRTGITIYWLRFAFIVTIVAGSAVAAIGGIPHLLSDTVLGLRTIAAINLAAMVLIRFRRDSSPDFVAGANDNASGVAAMLSLAERLAADRPNRVAMWFIATGSGHAACCGMHRVMEQKLFDPANTLFINIEEVGHGPLAYTTQEGILKRFDSSPVLISAAETVGEPDGVIPVRRRKPSSETLVASAHNFHAMTVTGAQPDDEQTSGSEVDVSAVEHAVSFVESIIRHIDDIPPELWSLG